MLKILVVEDTHYCREWIGHALAKTKAKLTFVQSGKIALEKLKQHKNYNAIIMNVTMPIMDGYKAAQQIRETGYTKPIIGYSALYYLEALRMAFKAGMSHYLIKTQNIEDLQGALHHLGFIKSENKPNAWNEAYFFTKHEPQPH